jgi:Tol biopolymer transport system component
MPLSLHIALVAVLLAGGCQAAPTRWGPAALSSAEYESTPTFSPDGKEVIFMRADPAFSAYRLVQSRCEAGGWTEPKPLPFAAKTPAWDADPFLTPDGRRLYFISTRQAPEKQAFDIWYVDRAPGGWAEPVRLPAPVNAEGSELLPRMDATGALNFGSDRPGGLGAGDIYVARQDSDGAWDVRNVGSPVSTPHFDYEAEVSQDGQTLIVVSDRGDRSRLYAYARRGEAWVETGRIPARDEVFQVGPLLSPDGATLLFAQADGPRSGEFFIHHLKPAMGQDSWPRKCPK